MRQIRAIIVAIVVMVLCLMDTPSTAEMAFIPAGEYAMGCHAETGETCWSDELPVHDVYIDAFYMDIYEVTNEQYCAYLNSEYGLGLIEVIDGVVYKEGSGTSYPYCDTFPSNTYSRINWNGSLFTVSSIKLDHPMVQVSWYGAAAYANWLSIQAERTPCYDLETWICDFDSDGFRLPTEAEWEKAARGGEYDPYFAYPWGNTIDGSQANYWASGDPYGGAWPQTTPVGYYDGNQTPPGVDMANGYGFYDMSGNAFEWCNDFYYSSYYSSSPYDNPHGPESSSHCVLRGASWDYDGETASNAERGGHNTEGRGYSIGFRLAMDASGTVNSDLMCLPSSGTVPFTTQMTVTLSNLFDQQTRRIAVRINAVIASGNSYSNWKSGWTNVAASSSYVTSWNQTIPELGNVIGDNVFTLEAEDVTPSPYNQPPYPPAGDTDVDSCTVTGLAP